MKSLMMPIQGVRRLIVTGCIGAVLSGVLIPGAFACPLTARPMPLPILGEAQSMLAQGRPISILAIGSSSTAGYGASRPQNTYPSQLALHLSNALGPHAVEVINAGVSGERGAATLRRLEAFMAQPEKPDLMIWQVGTNDSVLGGQPSRLAETVNKGLSAAKAAGVPVIIIDQQYYPLILNRHRYEDFVSAVDQTARVHGVSVLPRYAMMKDWAARDPEGFRKLLAWDRFHMNDAGYACLAQLLSDSILESLRGAQKQAGALSTAQQPKRANASGVH